MNRIVIVDCLRTPMGRSKQGSFRHIRAEDLSAQLMSGILQRHPQLDPHWIEDIYWGCVQQTLEQGFNIARNAALLAQLPKQIGAVTVNRLCGSSMQALHDAARSVMVGDSNFCLAGGVEHMGHVAMNHGIDIHPQLNHAVSKASAMMGLTAEVLAQHYAISRLRQDEFALSSHQKASQASQNHQFDKEILPIWGHQTDGTFASINTDEVIRHDATLNTMQTLSPAFDPHKGTVTAGNSSAISDGASVMLITTEQHAKQHNLPIRAIIRSMAVAGCEPVTMGLGPIPATHKALKRAKLTLQDIDAIELNEAFAAQSLACIEALGLEDVLDTKINLHGGAIALGHPLGCSGARICTSLINVMEEKNAQFGLATMCIGMGQGIATIFERP
ncbi:acetyl-CoA C-acyltransferase FadA [Vibrio palustris]|uniref:acetyl-CoA C-acyltransferase n=1 Tax=Vibrio palustris TaxID=1918946 RepID=A0A1R4B7M8_9VIBR|nr:acetyl-CoA C-acyltransferase FadA [Vibrio palustris]SJL84871.1 3-ketoacyl-CoA thiolase [Vibrio palustris]